MKKHNLKENATSFRYETEAKNNYNSDPVQNLNFDSLSLDSDLDLSFSTDSTLESSETPLDFLTKMFNSISSSELSQKLEENFYDLPLTIEKLLSNSKSEIVQEKPQQEAEISYNPQHNPVDASVKICRHFIEGNCFRKDCWFRHSFDTVLCKFFLKGYCSNGDNCQFVHNLPALPPAQPKPVILKSTTVSVPDSSKDFPSLGGNSTSNATNFSKKEVKGYDKAVKFSKLKVKMPWLNDQILEQYLMNCDYDSERAYSILVKRFPKPKNFVSKTKPTTQPAPEIINTKIPLAKRIQKLRRIRETVPWYDFGHNIKERYQKYRKEAIIQLKLRNQCYDKSRTNYLSGRPDLARKYADEAKIYHEQMLKCHDQAAETIFKENNQGKGNIVDLHGLFVAEVEFYLKSVLNKKKSGEPIYILVGTGHHSSDIPKLLPGVLDILDRCTQTYFDCSPDGKGGMLKVI